jgi:uncharacterized protein YjbI with pentapeptide repeats
MLLKLLHSATFFYYYICGAMKKLYFTLLLLVVANWSESQIINIPDTHLKNRLLSANTTFNIASDINGNFMVIDTNHDHEIQLNEALAVYKLSISQSFVTDLTGLTEFTNLTELYSDVNFLTNTIVDLSGLTQLHKIVFRYSNLTGVIFPSPNVLVHINFQDNNLTAMDLTVLPMLKVAYLFQNNLESINLSGLDINLLDLSWNNLSQLDLSNFNTFNLYCDHNNLTSLDISDCPDLMIFDASHNDLHFLNVKNGGSFIGLSLSDNPNIESICADAFEINYIQEKLNQMGNTNCTLTSDCNLGGIDASFNQFAIAPNPAYDRISIQTNPQEEIKSISIYDMMGRHVLNRSYVSDYIDISELQTGAYVIRIFANNETSSLRFIKK